MRKLHIEIDLAHFDLGALDHRRDLERVLGRIAQNAPTDPTAIVKSRAVRFLGEDIGQWRITETR